MALEDLEGKRVSLKGSGGICRIFEWLEAFVQKNICSCIVWKFFWDFWWILVVIGVVGPVVARMRGAAALCWHAARCPLGSPVLTDGGRGGRGRQGGASERLTRA
jgi:hypothetical protein